MKGAIMFKRIGTLLAMALIWMGCAGTPYAVTALPTTTVSLPPTAVPTDPTSQAPLPDTPSAPPSVATALFPSPLPSPGMPATASDPTSQAVSQATDTAAPASETAPSDSAEGSIASFEAIPAEAAPGDSIKLRWSTTATEVLICPIYQSIYDAPCIEGSGSGEADVTIPSYYRNLAQYVLQVNPEASGPSATVDVTLDCPNVWFFEDPPRTCAKSSVITTQAAYQPFEHGFMIWTETDHVIEVFFDDSQPLSVRPPIVQASDGWKQGDPESDPAIVPPSGFYQPVRGFGLVWRTKDNIGNWLGWATAPETAYQTPFQCDAIRTSFNSTGSRYCYIIEPTGKVIEFSHDGWSSEWRFWGTP